MELHTDRSCIFTGGEGSGGNGGETGVTLKWSSGSAGIWRLCPSAEPGTDDSSSSL